MVGVLDSLFLIAEGRGEDPAGAGGILVVVGIALGVALLAIIGLLLVRRFGRTRPEVQERRPHRRGRVGRV